MKKIILSSIALVFGVAAQAQTSNTGNVTLNVHLKPIQTLTVNPNLDVVDLTYATKEDYAGGVSSKKDDQISVYSTGGFRVSVKAAGAWLENSQAGVNGLINANSIKIKAEAGSKALAGAQYNEVALDAQTAQTIISSTKGAVDRTFNVDYKGALDNAYVDYYVDGQDPTTYTTTLTYTIVAQ